MTVSPDRSRIECAVRYKSKQALHVNDFALFLLSCIVLLLLGQHHYASAAAVRVSLSSTNQSPPTWISSPKSHQNPLKSYPPKSPPGNKHDDKRPPKSSPLPKPSRPPAADESPIHCSTSSVQLVESPKEVCVIVLSGPDRLTVNLKSGRNNLSSYQWKMLVDVDIINHACIMTVCKQPVILI